MYIFKQQGKYDDLPYVGMEDIESKTGIFLGTENITSVQSSTFFFEENDALFGRLRPYLGKVYLAEFSGHCSTEIFPIRVKKDLLASYLKLWLLSDKTINSINETCTGARMPRADMNEVLSFEIPVPPLEEQKRIVKILDEKFAQLETLKANAQTNLQNAKDLFQSQITKAFSNTTWEKKRLGEVCELISGYAFDSKGYTTDDNDTLLICGDNIMHCSFRWETVKRWPKEQYSELKRFELQDSDIVLAMDRPWIKSGLKISKITKNELPSLLVQRTAALRTSNKLLSAYLYYALQEQGFSKYLIEQQTGVGVPHIRGKQILNYEVCFPRSPSKNES